MGLLSALTLLSRMNGRKKRLKLLISNMPGQEKLSSWSSQDGRSMGSNRLLLRQRNASFVQLCPTGRSDLSNRILSIIPKEARDCVHIAEHLES